VLLQNECPETLTKIEREGKRFTFSHGFLARREVAELEIRISFLHSSPPPKATDDSPNPDFSRYEEISRLKEFVGEANTIVDSFDCTVHEAPNTTIRVCDLSRTVHLFAGAQVAGSLATVFGQMNPSGNLTYLRGISDFFYERGANLECLSISQGMNETFYSKAREDPAVLEAPKGGLVTFTNLQRGEAAVIEFTISPSTDNMPERTWNRNFSRRIYEIVRVYADGELVLTFANEIEVDLL
jgi:hypothetical protein